MVKFKAYVIKGGRITIPQVEREAAQIKEGDIVEVELYKVKIPRGGE